MKMTVLNLLASKQYCRHCDFLFTFYEHTARCIIIILRVDCAMARCLHVLWSVCLSVSCMALKLIYCVIELFCKLSSFIRHLFS